MGQTMRPGERELNIIEGIERRVNEELDIDDTAYSVTGGNQARVIVYDMDESVDRLTTILMEMDSVIDITQMDEMPRYVSVKLSI